MGAQRKLDNLEQAKRISQIERFILRGLSTGEMAERLGVSYKTVQRDLKHRLDGWTDQIERSTLAYRASILSELGRLYAEMTKDAADARQRNEGTAAYASPRIDILRMVAKLTGAEQPLKVEVTGAMEHQIRLVVDTDLRRMTEIRCQIEDEVAA